MDHIDRKIVAELENDGRMSFAALSERVGVSKSPAWQRVRALEEAGVIRGFHAEVSPSALGLVVECLVDVQIRLDAHIAFEDAVLAHPAVIECRTTAGDSDYVLRIFARSMEHLDDLLRHDLSKLPGVHRLSTKIFLKTIKSRSSLTKWAVASAH
ncbi:Lrp/AsnC family transcriptional regulator [Sphingobium sp.]|uniref:Lrp/AsnC family transcriptional regulator n=1 Tax=Sphingobium sp. TaxID=1912891 RepID=UPI0028BECB17|nr:Lrp/AsnC family transcriptional regulator [Sphingobium sp.]